MREKTKKAGDNILTRKEIGKRGEEIAAEFLERKGLRIVERNYHCRWGELDLVAVRFSEEEGSGDRLYYDDETGEMTVNDTMSGSCGVHFVEVKTRTGRAYGAPGEAVTYRKQQKIKKTALTWLQEQPDYFRGISFDVIDICVESGTAKIRWLQHCF